MNIAVIIKNSILRIALITVFICLVLVSAGRVYAADDAVANVSAKSTDFKKITLSWSPLLIEAEGGFQEETAGNAENTETKYETVSYMVYRSLSKSGKYTHIKTVDSNRYTDTGMTPGKTYYYKVRAVSSKGKHAYSPVASASVLRQKSASMELLCKDGKFFDMCKEAGQKLYGYDTLQGACANKGIAYLTLYNRNVEKCRIVKVKLDTLDVIKVSKPLKIYHGNSLTYNTRTNRIIAACCYKSKMKCVAIVNARTLKVESIKTIKLNSRIPKSVRKTYKGISAIAYNEKYNCYFARLSGSGDWLKLNSRLTPVKYVKVSGKKKYLLNQSIETVGGRVYDVQSFKGKHKYSMVTIRTLSGKFIGQVKFPYGKSPGQELECIFHDGSQLYAGFYLTTSQAHDYKSYGVKRKNYIYKVFTAM